MIRIVVFCLGLLLAAPSAQAQHLGCDPVTNPCTVTAYGLGNDSPEGPFNNTRAIVRLGPLDGACGPEVVARTVGQIKIREQDNCTASASSRCRVEIPQVETESGFLNPQRLAFDFGPVGLVIFAVANLTDFGVNGNIGHRQLSGTCGVSGDECALDSECDAQNAGDLCTSTCFSDPGTSCSAEDDAACANLDCRTEIEWDGIGLCTDHATVCTSDADCTGEDVCFAGLEFADSNFSGVCCQSTSGVVCAGFAVPEYPAVAIGATQPPENHTGTGDWLFEGGRGTNWDLEIVSVPGQQEGICNVNRSRPCGVLGDFYAGGANGKCTGDPPCAADPFDVNNPALASGCDDVDFGGLAGDFCDLSENGLRAFSGLNPDGSQDVTVCPRYTRLVGTAGSLCSLPDVLPAGDPQPGCQLNNIGVAGQPDLDCDGIVDTTQGRCQPEGGVVCSDTALCPVCAIDDDCASGNCINNGDLCPAIAEFNAFQDTNNDDIGDQCQCGDGNADGAITGLDIAATSLCANGATTCDATLVDATGDNATTAEDIGGIVSVVNGVIPTSDLKCVRNP